MRYCDALTSATGYGCWLFPPMDLQLYWDGEEIFWSHTGGVEWLPLSATASGAIQYPGQAGFFNEHAPESLRGYSPPFLTALPEVGGVQIWTGLLARTSPGWSLNVRSPVNLPGTAGLVPWEGIVETDHWFGPLFSNFRITKTDSVVNLRAHIPFLQVQPIPQAAYREQSLNDFAVKSVEELDEDDWENLTQVLVPSAAKIASQGTYAVRLRKRRSCPHHAAMVEAAIR